MFAGPNGSGKSTLKAYLPSSLLGIYLNPDEIEQSIRNRGFLDFAEHGVTTDKPEVHRSGDNADRSHTWLAEVTDGKTLELKTDQIPAWFKRTVLDQATAKP
jgi:hypothetical protein